MTPFRQQLQQCHKDGTAFTEKCVIKGDLEHLMCKKFGGQCMSNKCEEYRSNK